MLKQGDNPGPWPGAGRPSSKVRELCRQGFEKALPQIIEIADGTKDYEGRRPNPAEQTRAFAELGKFGLGEAKVLVPEHLTQIVAQVLGECDFLTDEQAVFIGSRLDAAISDM